MDESSCSVQRIYMLICLNAYFIGKLCIYIVICKYFVCLKAFFVDLRYFDITSIGHVA